VAKTVIATVALAKSSAMLPAALAAKPWEPLL
jgi:hypothetical protein